MNNANKLNNDFTFDTCIGISMRKVKNLENLLKCKIDFKNSMIHLTSRTRLEATKNGYNFDNIVQQIESSLQTKVVYGRITSALRRDAKNLLKRCSTLHPGDSEILAYAISSNTTLLTSDKGLLQAANIVKVPTINPNTLTCSYDNYVISRSRNNKSFRNPSLPKRAKSLLKHGEKIIWRSFV